ncbi:DNA-binding transcriptional LysR family regulator [Nitrospirillum amazonense]|uniref:DNA-binding transcriptional LysR family regulator n=1 Tax=Nitrospirillum amazonense TaxID=28077 RepID=A0A560JFQ0_9PROT|nr:LysR family transcriptional regulator [Nitrospirillum amazonense]TWB69866.1 DNA-binding transcriptional LysR family regulator [Nitrospirillum amazonense]
MRLDFEFGEVLAFVTVAQTLNFRAAADRLHLSQPALSRRVEKLEAALEMRLLERTTRKVDLTEAGRQFLNHAVVILEELELARASMVERASRAKQLVTVACVPSVANHVLPGILRLYAQTHPGVRIRIIDESAGKVLDAVMGGEADIGISFLGAQNAEVDFIPIRSEPYVLAVRRDHPLAAAAAARWDSLEAERLIAVSLNSGNRILIENVLAGLPRRPTIHYEANHVAGALGLVSAGLGVAVLPALALANNAYPGLVGIPMRDPELSRTLGLVTRAGTRLSQPASALHDLILQKIGE